MNEFKPIARMMRSKNRYVSSAGQYLAYLWQYRHMLFSMVKKDFKGKFRHSTFGYLWHVINPLTQIIIYMIVFTSIFGRDIPNYWAYISTGVFALNFFSSSMSAGTNAIIGHAGMVSRMSFPREILVFSTVIINLITFCISYVITILLIIITGTNTSAYILFSPVILIMLIFFSSGVALLFSAINVYWRDMTSVVSIIMMCIMFITPIFYMSNIDSSILQSVIWTNPLTYYIDSLHDLVYSGIMPPLAHILICFVLASVTFIIGLVVFKKLEKGFAERI